MTPTPEGAMTALEALALLRGMRVFLTSRERIKQPEGSDLFDECIAALAAMQQPVTAWRTDWPEMTMRDSRYPNQLDSGRVIVTLTDGTVTVDRAEKFGDQEPGWFIHQRKVCAWQPFPKAFALAGGAAEGGRDG